MAGSYLDALADQYYQRNSLTSPRRNSAGASGVAGLGTLPNLPTPIGRDAFVNRLDGAIGPQSTLGKIIDVASRPLYGVANFVKETAADPIRDLISGTRDANINQAFDRGDNPINAIFNSTIGAVNSGLSGRSKTLMSDAVLENWVPKNVGEGVGRFAAGLALDIGADPLTYVPGGIILGAAKKLPGAATAVSALQKAGSLAKPAQELPAVARTAESVAEDAAAVASATEKVAPVKRDIFEPFLQKSVSQAAVNQVRFTADGKRVYDDFRKLPNLYVKPAAPAAAKVASDTREPADIIKEWLSTNARAGVKNTDEGTYVFTGKNADAGTQSLGELTQDMLTMRATGNNAGANMLWKDIQRLFEQSRGVIETGASKTTPNPVDLASVRRTGARGTPRYERVRGQLAKERLQYLKDRLDPEDYNYLTRARSDATYKARRTEILARVNSPIMPKFSRWHNAPEGSFLTKQLGEPILPSEVKVGDVLNANDPAVSKAISSAADVQFKAREAGYKYTSRRGTARTNVKMGKGLGISDRGFNKRAQYHVWQSLLSDASSALKGTNISGSARGEVLRKTILRQLDETDAVLRSRGIEPILGSGNEGIPLSFADILHALDKSDSGRTVMLYNLFDRKGASLSVTNLSDAAELLLTALRDAGVGDVKGLQDFLRTMRVTAGEKNSLMQRLAWELVKTPGGSWSKTAEAVARRTAKGEPAINKGFTRLTTTRVWDKALKRTVEKTETRTLGGKELEQAAQSVLRGLTNHTTVRELMQRNMTNAARYEKQLAEDVASTAEPVLKEFFRTWGAATTSTGEAIKAYSTIEKAVDVAADAADATDVARKVSKDLVISEIDDALAGDIAALEKIKTIVAGSTKAEDVVNGQAMHDLIAAEAAEDSVTALVDLGENIGESLNLNIIRAMFPFTTRAPESFVGRVATGSDNILSRFIPQAGHATLRPAIAENTSVVRYIANHWRNALTQVHRAFPEREKLAPVFARLQAGMKIEGTYNPAQLQAIEQMKTLLSKMFEPNAERGVDAATDVFFRNAAQVEHVNAKLAASGLPEHMRYDIYKAVQTASKEGISLKAALSKQWTTWRVDDPIDFMAKMQHAATSTHVDMSIAREAFRIAKSKGLASMKRRDGFVQIVDTSEKSVLTRYLPAEAWYHRDIVEEIRAMDNVLSQSLSFTSPFGQWVNKYMDPFLNAWKAGMTIYRPGHHVRNLVGDSSLSFLADGIGKPHQVRNTLKIMAYKGNYDDFSALRALQSGGTDLGEGASLSQAALARIARGDEFVANVTLRGGKKVRLTAKEVNDYARSHGMLPDFVTGEDLLNLDKQSETLRSLQEMMSLSGGKVRAAAGAVSESRDDFVRLSHFLLILEKNRNFKSAEELMDYAVRRVRKWHPDGTDLTPFESKVMRRVFPFYSWTKKTMPLVVESMFTQPGRVMAWPKAMYNLAQASGVDPTSLADPFPKDQLFPSFLTDEMTGPVSQINGRYYGINPGVASNDILNQFLGDPKAGILSMLTPAIKIPAEMLTSRRLDTGSAIPDTTEYVGSNIPGVSHLNSLTGTDIIGSILEGQGIQPITSVKKGNRDRMDEATWLNFLLGLGITDMSKPNYINFAEIEKRNRMSNG